MQSIVLITNPDSDAVAFARMGDEYCIGCRQLGGYGDHIKQHL